MNAINYNQNKTPCGETVPTKISLVPRVIAWQVFCTYVYLNASIETCHKGQDGSQQTNYNLASFFTGVILAEMKDWANCTKKGIKRAVSGYYPETYMDACSFLVRCKQVFRVKKTRGAAAPTRNTCSLRSLLCHS